MVPIGQCGLQKGGMVGLPAGGLALVDAIGPFFRGLDQRRINWSKIPFHHWERDLDAADGIGDVEARWAVLRDDVGRLAAQVRALGYNAATLDDVAHVTDDPWHDGAVRERIALWRVRMREVVGILRSHGLRVYFTSDFLTTSEGVDRRIGRDPVKAGAWFAGLCGRFLDDFPDVDGVILRIGESDGLDVRDPLRSKLMVRSAREVRRMLVQVLPQFEERGRYLVFRTWTVGAYLVGDPIWHRGRLACALDGVDSPALMVSMKHGESDFFRYLPLNRHFFRVTQPKIIEFQARREYEGAGEYPSFIGWEVEKTVREMAGVDGLAGFSVWCQTGGWHAFRRLAFLDPDARWIEINAAVVPPLMRGAGSVESVLDALFGPESGPVAVELLRRADLVIRELLYIEEFARQKLFFRRVRIPPLLHVYWDNLFVVSALRTTLGHFVHDPETAVRQGEAAFAHFDEMEPLARSLGLPVEDIQFMRDTFELVLLARRYFFLPQDAGIEDAVVEAKARYKARWPPELRQRYRIRVSFSDRWLNRRAVAWIFGLMTRRQRGYRRVLDHVFTLKTLSWIYRLFRSRHQRALPKFLRRTAMGVDSLFR